MSLRPVNQRIQSSSERGSSGQGQLIKVLGQSGAAGRILGAIIQNTGQNRMRRSRSGEGRIPQQAIDVFQQSARAILTRKTAASKAGGAPRRKVQSAGPPEVFRETPGPSALPPPRIFNVPSRDFLTGGKPVVQFPAGAAIPPDPIDQIVSPRPIPALPPAKPKVAPVSLHKSIIKSIGTGLSGAITQRLGGQSKAVPIVAAAAGAAGRVLPALGRVLGSRTVAAGATGIGIGSLFGGGGGDACQAGFHFAKDGSGRCVRNRRMNFGNARAARRSVRRLKGARKLLQDIEKMMPRRPAPRARAQHHHHPHHHPAAGGN